MFHNMNICKWIRNDNTQCVLNSIKDKNYCKLHKKFENLYKPEILNSLLRCKRCKKICEKLNDIDKCDRCMIIQNNFINKRKKNKIKCKWINQKSEPCPFNTLDNNEYCKHHIKYNGKKINILVKCSTCRNMFEAIDNEKICLKCKEISKKNRDKKRENKIFCKAIIKKTGKQCNYKQSNENEYCKKHQNYKKIKDLENKKVNICSNKNRGCTNILEYDDKSKCKKCKLLANNTKINTSNTLYDNHYTRYKSEANRRNIKWELTKEDTYDLFTQNCYYCNYNIGINGIDRIEPTNTYNLLNVVSCCKYCNIMKNTKSLLEFKNIITHLFNVLIKKNYNNNVHNEIYFETSKNKNFKYYKYSSEKRNISFQIDNTLFDKIITMPCYYCKLFTEKGCKGIDRIDSNKGYDINNIVPCCKTCNIMKNDLSIECFTIKIKKIYNKLIENKNVIYNDTKTNLLTILSKNNYKMCDFKPIRMLKEHLFYQNKIFNGNIIDITNMNLSLEFIDTSNKLEYSIWQYYRRYISRFKRISTNVDRQIYILVKDNNTNSYIGIISLSNDIKYLQSRDKYIEWKSKEYLTNNKLKYIMNVTTCVCTQPFGYNFNGGKLLISLVFSKEVLMYIKEKYNIYIQGFTITSLYGKSIQYDRLKFIKFIGYTQCITKSDIPNDIVDFCKEFLQKNNYDMPKNNILIVTETLKKLNIPFEDFLQTTKKGIYFGFTSKESKLFLQGKTYIEPNPIEFTKNINEIYTWWVNRWALQRFNHLEETNRLKNYNQCIKDITEQILD